MICSLLLTPITSYSNELADVAIQKGKPAPFSGVLVSEPRYRAYSEAVTVAELYAAAPVVAAEPRSEFKNYLLAGAGGLVVGLVSGVFLAR